MNTKTMTAQNCSLFEIDFELEEAFEQLQEEREITGYITDEARERCVALFAELGKKIDRIAAYLRTQQRKASMAAEEAQRLQQRRRSAEQRVSDVKEMLTYFMRCRSLKRLEGELNTIRLQTNSQPSVQIDDWELPQEFCLHIGSIPHRSLKEMLEHLPGGLKGEFLQAMINTQPIHAVGSGFIATGGNRCRSQARTRISHPYGLVGGKNRPVPRRPRAFQRSRLVQSHGSMVVAECWLLNRRCSFVRHLCSAAARCRKNSSCALPLFPDRV